MTNPTAKRWRPRFSIRTLASVVTLVCAYLACWGPTKRYGAPTGELLRDPISTDFPAPLVVRTIEIDGAWPSEYQVYHRYYLWAFGPAFKLPIEIRLSDQDTHNTLRAVETPSQHPTLSDGFLIEAKWDVVSVQRDGKPQHGQVGQEVGDVITIMREGLRWAFG